jgi:signal transduction histidine kinase
LRARDLAIGIALAAAVMLEAALSSSRDGSVAVNLILYAPIGLLFLAQPLRPLEFTLALIAAMSLVSLSATDVAGMTTTLLLLLVAVFRAASALGDRTAAVAGLALLVAIPVVTVEHGSANVGDYLFPVVIFAITASVARGLRHRALLARELALRNERLEVEREAQAAAAVSDERRRIARELHDVVAHSVSVMVVQSGAARRVLDAEPDHAVAALAEVERSGRQALSELRRLLGLMRDGDESAAVREPQPTLAGLDDLVERARDAGLPVELRQEGTPFSLPMGCDLAAYRVVQESLTNALKHAGDGARATVLLRWSDDRLDLDISDTGQGLAVAAPDGDGPLGQGLLGMRERVALCGGDLQAGPSVRGGFRVHATIPKDREAA